MTATAAWSKPLAMDAPNKLSRVNGAPFAIFEPTVQSIAVVLSSPHSGRHYTPEFLASARLDPQALRRSEDSFVDDLFADAPRLGAPLLCALFPRAYVDVNREAYELDPAMFEDSLPDYANTRSPRVAAGLGTIARVVASGQDIYRHKLRFNEAKSRIDQLYRPYHDALARLTRTTINRFGHCILIDCHSMPSIGGPTDLDKGSRRLDCVLGDAYGTACARAVTERALAVLKGFGYKVALNNPYAGGYTTQHYGRPRKALHALQIEINRGLYMDETAYARSGYFPVLAGHMSELVAALGKLRPRDLES